jgi:isocitrate dehydrogenase
MYWAQELAAQEADAELQAFFAPLAESLSDNEEKVVEELNSVQGRSVDLGGYFIADADRIREVMRPSATLNAVLASARA